MNKINIIATVVPLIIVAVGLVGWVITLRSDISVAQSQLAEVKESIIPLEEQAKNGALEINSLHKLIEDLDQIEAITSEVDVLINRLEFIEEAVDENSPEIERLKSNLRLANDQMETIMADHMGFNDVLRDLNASGLLPSGEKRQYGNYGD